eukprot:TRINITY_DN5887_c0_g1_i2.p1 TRINITY_DN5887_c0_g1~~TRINITY_DN5887_c0_g1_i2.p1  ORF type:complete len:261 (-),score=62.70 TRINITY_DN5887_c0_g1_i2:317-1099(-)
MRNLKIFGSIILIQSIIFFIFFQQQLHREEEILLDNNQRRCFVSIISEYKVKYGAWAMLTGFWLRHFHPQIPRIILHIEQLPMEDSERELLMNWGWQVREVKGIEAPIPTLPQYHWLFTKLRLWEMTDFDRIIFLDLDIAILGNFNELWALPHSFEFAAVMDIMDHKKSVDLNAGMLMITPSLSVSKELMRLMNDTQSKEEYSKYGFAEQGFFNWYYQHNYLMLPSKFNFNVESMHKCRLYEVVEDDIRMVHFTTHKPDP